MILSLFSAVLSISNAASTINLTLSISDTVIRSIPETLIGFNLDYWENNTESFGTSSIPYIDFTNKDLITLTNALSPAVLRLGGSAEDSVIYNISGECYEAEKWNITGSYYCSEVKPPNYFCMNMTRWQQIFEFIEAANLELVYGLNACYGRKSNDEMMDISNIDSLLQYTSTAKSIGFNISRIRGFEFGNGMSNHIESQIYSYDFIRLNTLINRYFMNYTKNIPITIGTDNRYDATNYVEQVLKKMANGTMKALNYHQYINCEPGQIGVNQSLFDMDCLNKINQYPDIYENILLNDTHQYNTTIWIGESALHSSGGINGETNVFLSSFYYTFQLCELVKYKYMEVVLRQTLSGGNYGLLNGTNNIFVPTPDYYVLYLWRQFIGNQMIQSSFMNGGNEYITGYAFNGKTKNEIVIVIINFSFISAANVMLELKGGNKGYKFEEYHMNGPLNSSTAFINGQALIYNNGKFPVLTPKTGNGNVMVESTTIVWIRCLPQ